MVSRQVTKIDQGKICSGENNIGVYLKTVALHDFSQLSRLNEQLSSEKKHITIFIVRVPPVVARNSEETAKLVNELYSQAIKIGYSVFSLGYERIVITPNTVHVEDILPQKFYGSHIN